MVKYQKSLVWHFLIFCMILILMDMSYLYIPFNIFFKLCLKNWLVICIFVSNISYNKGIIYFLKKLPARSVTLVTQCFLRIKNYMFLISFSFSQEFECKHKCDNLDNFLLLYYFSFWHASSYPKFWSQSDAAR